MNVALVDVDSRIPNLALMKLSAWHKAQGDTVEMFDPLWSTPDKVYAAKVFDFSDDYAYFPECEVVKGGTGYSLDTHLASEAEHVFPDYNLYGCTYALGRITRGCVRRCPWCVVWKQDGVVREVGALDEFWNDQTHLRLLDDNLTALPGVFVRTCNLLADRAIRTQFEALDIRFIDDTAAAALARVKRWGQVHFAFDEPAIEPAVRRGIEALKRNGFPLWAATFYVLVGFDTTPEQDLYRVELLRSLGVESFVMPFDKADRYQRDFARWCNHKAVFKTVAWSEYRRAS